MRKTYAAKLRNALSASIASGHLCDDLNELTRAELEFIAHDWEIWARDDQLAPLLIAPGDSPAGSRPPGALDDARDSPNKAAASGRLAGGESEAAINKAWRVWLLLGGRGSGKTRAGAEWIRSLALAPGDSPPGSRPPGAEARIALVGKTLSDVRNVMIEGQSGLLAIHPAHERPLFEPSKRRLTWPSGAVAELFSADEAEALRGPQFTAAWCDELAKWRGAEKAWDMLQFALRLGEAPRVCVTTTPRTTKLLKQIIADEATVTVNLATADNATNLAPSFLAEMTRRYAGWQVALDQLEAALPNAKSVSLVVSWFGTDLRAGECQLKPGVETRHKSTAPLTWSVAGATRDTAHLISTRGGNAAYGGTPSDQTVIAAIQDMKARGINVTLTPFILMDIGAGNALANPYGGASQPVYPWRGRITCHPAPGQPGTPDTTPSAVSQIAAFVGSAAASDFSLAGTTVHYSGPDEWSYRRMVLHQAFLAKAAGGVEAFVIGTELRGLTWVRSAAGTYPFVSALIALAADVKSVLGASTKVLYAADWTEYFGHHPGDGSGDVYFHLDPLWSSASIDAIGIDLYWPLADWRQGRDHLDAIAGASSIYDAAYLRANVQGGEGFDWYYATEADRDAQVRTPITDGYGKPWVFRYKDILSWWRNQHFNRPGGVESGTPTAWVPQSKPFWLMEIGCPAVDKGANQPNVFVDPKSSESAYPYYSRGFRDDLMQARHRQVLTDAFDWTKPGYVAGLNPVSAITGARMVDLAHIHVYCWDARPFPAFPSATTYWGDGENWEHGHWVNGRLGGAALNDAVSAILTEQGFTEFDASGLTGTVPGYVIDRTMSARDAIQPLELAYFFDSIESDGKIVFRHRGRADPATSLGPDGLVEEDAADALYELTRAQETDLPASAKVRYISSIDDYPQAVAEARRLTGASGRTSEADLPIVLDDGLAGTIAESWLYETWATRESATFKLPPSALALEPGDIVAAEIAGRSRLLRLTDVSEHGVRDVKALSIDPSVYDQIDVSARSASQPPSIQIGPPSVALMDLPQWNAAYDASSGYAATMQKPWPGSVAIFASPQDTGYQLKAIAGAAGTIGRTLDDLLPGPEGRLDRGAAFRVKLTNGTLASADLVAMLAGANVAALRNASGDWEIIQFQTAELVDVQTYRLGGLLRGQFGTESAMTATIPGGAQFVLLDGSVTRVPVQESERKIALNWRCGPGNRDIGDASYVTQSFAYQGLGLRPLSPVHVRAKRSSGDVILSWTRRTRAGGDNWELPDVPLGEESESYEVDVLDGATVKRTLTASSPSVVYSSAAQLADFGSLQPSVSVNVYQTNVLFGRGAPRAALV